MLALLGLLAISAFPAGSGKPATAAPNPSLPLSLGLGPSSLFPISGGVPIYTVGETVWAEANFGYSVPVFLDSPSGASVAAPQLNLDPQVVTPIYTFTHADPEGVWNVTLETTSGIVIVPVRFVNLASHRPALLGPLQYSLAGRNLSVSAQANVGGSYDQEVCSSGGSAGGSVIIALPRNMGDYGNLTLSPGAPFGISILGVLSEPVSFWFELDQSYGLASGGTTNFVATNLMVAQSQPFDIVADGPSATSFALSAPLRDGRYDLRAFFQNSTNLEVFQSRVLVLNSTYWVSLSNDCIPQVAQSSGISYSAGLSGSPAGWPRTLYYMYRVSGVEDVASYALGVNISSVNFVATPWNKPVADASVKVDTSVGVLQTGEEGGSLFILASNYPAELNYSLSIGGAIDLAGRSLAAENPHSTQTVLVSLARLTVHVSGGQASPVTLEVTGPAGLNITRAPLGSNRTVSLFLPTGSYTVTASQSGESQSAQVGVTDGASASVTVEFGALTGLEVALVITAVIAAAANLIVWAMRARGPRPWRLRPKA